MWHEIQRVLAYNFGGKWEYPHETFPGDVPRGTGGNVGIIFGRPASYNLGKQKTYKM